jgi:hypothetical protein
MSVASKVEVLELEPGESHAKGSDPLWLLVHLQPEAYVFGGNAQVFPSTCQKQRKQTHLASRH